MISRPAIVSQSFTNRSLPADASQFPSGLKATPLTPAVCDTLLTAVVCPRRVWITRQPFVSQSFIVESALAEARSLLLELNAKLLTVLACPARVASSRPVRASQTFTRELSEPLVARNCPSGLKLRLECEYL